MSLKDGRMSYDVLKSIRICCCGTQSHIEKSDLQKLVIHPEDQLAQLAETYESHIAGQPIYDIREYFHDSHIPFRWRGCSRSSLACCGSCTKICRNRCPQDVLMRAHLICANILHASNEEERQQRYNKSPTYVQLLYDELSSALPKYFVLSEMISVIISPGYNTSLKKEMEEIYNYEDNPYRLDYAPTIEYEPVPGSRPEEGKLRKKVNTETGEVSVLDWPRSGMCPFCLPTGLSERRRKR